MKKSLYIRSKYEKNKPAQNRSGFSLAEALITLLIVCLITLASVPVITKKHRALNSNANGMWMCTSYFEVLETDADGVPTRYSRKRPQKSGSGR